MRHVGRPELEPRRAAFRLYKRGFGRGNARRRRRSFVDIGLQGRRIDNSSIRRWFYLTQRRRKCCQCANVAITNVAICQFIRHSLRICGLEIGFGIGNTGNNGKISRASAWAIFVPHLGFDAYRRFALLEVEVFRRDIRSDRLKVVVVGERQIRLRRLHDERHVADEPALHLIEVRRVPLVCRAAHVAGLVPWDRLVRKDLRPPCRAVVGRDANGVLARLHQGGYVKRRWRNPRFVVSCELAVNPDINRLPYRLERQKRLACRRCVKREALPVKRHSAPEARLARVHRPLVE